MHKEEIASVIISYITMGVIVIGAIILLVFLIQPEKMVAKNRDSNRLTDLTKLETSINLYLADKKNFDHLQTGLPYESRQKNLNAESPVAISGEGWLPLNLQLVSSGVPLLKLPLDPKNTLDLYYRVGVDVAHQTYEINCRFEDPQSAQRYKTDHGNSDDWYEIGTDLTILK